MGVVQGEKISPFSRQNDRQIYERWIEQDTEKSTKA